MININSLMTTIENETKKMNPEDQLIISTFKKDRHLILIRQNDNEWSFQTNGYTHELIQNLSLKEAIKCIKKYRDIEFPRSNKIYISLRKKK